jgi:hypothetical protein
MANNVVNLVLLAGILIDQFRVPGADRLVATTLPLEWAAGYLGVALLIIVFSAMAPPTLPGAPEG